MLGDGYDRRTLLVGEEWRLTRAALVGAGVLFLIGMVVDYVSLSSVIAGRDHAIIAYVRRIFHMVEIWEHGLTPWTWVYGYLLVASLAGIHAYFNLGYLTSLLLALSPNIGTALWSIHGLDEYMTLTPLLVFDRVLPEGPVVATLGFLIGVSLRFIHQPPPAPDSPQPNVPDR